MRRGIVVMAAGAVGCLLLTAGFKGWSTGAAAEPDNTVAKWGAKQLDEEQLIRRRHEWFFASRRPGAGGALAERRFEAVRASNAMAEAEGVAATPVWKPRGPFSSTFDNWRFGKVAGRVACLAKDFGNNILYLGSASGGVWKTTSEGASWTPIFDAAGTLTVGAIAIDPSNSSTLWVGTGENSASCEEYFGIGLLRSTDGGSTWEIRNGSAGKTLGNIASFISIIVDPRNTNRVIVGGSQKDCASGAENLGGIYTTDDAGASWTSRLSGISVTRIAKDPKNHDLLWAGCYNKGLYESIDGGNKWIIQKALPTGSSVGRVEVAVAPSDGKYVYALFGSKPPQFWRTTDGGAKWVRMTSGTTACDGQCWYNMFLAVHPKNPSTIFRGTILVYKSVDGGATWSNLTNSWGPWQKVHQDTHALLIDPKKPDTMYVGSDGGIWKTTNGGTSFTNMNSNLSLTQFYDVGIHPTNNDIIVGGAQDNSSLARTSSDTWALQEVTGDGFVSIINPVVTNTVYTASYPWDDGEGDLPSVMRSTNGLMGPFGWITDGDSGVAPGDRVNWVTPYALDPRNPNTMFVGTHRVYRSLNGGSQWSPVGPDDMTSGGTYDYLNTVNISDANGSYVYAGTTDGRIWRTTDGGTAWSEISTGLPAARWINDVAPDPGDPNKAFCVVSGFGTAHVYELNGSTWKAKGGGLPNIPANTILALSPKNIYVGTDVGIYKSSDRGATFKIFGSGMPKGLVVMDLEYNSTTQYITAGTYGRGAWQIGPIAP